MYFNEVIIFAHRTIFIFSLSNRFILLPVLKSTHTNYSAYLRVYFKLPFIDISGFPDSARVSSAAFNSEKAAIFSKVIHFM